MHDQEDYCGMTRRRFLALAGGAAGLAAMAMMKNPEGWAANELAAEDNLFALAEDEADVLVLGGGMAGLFAAVKAHDAGARVLLVSKGRVGSSGQTPFARGIFSYDPDAEDMSVDDFVAAVSASALGTNNPVYTRQVAEHSRERVEELREWGFFESPLYNDAFMKPLEERKIRVMERVMVTHLVDHDGRIGGAAGFALDGEKVHVFRAPSVILCTGAGGFKPNGFPINDLTHDGSVMAYDIGAKITGKEWNDGHGGRGNNPAACFDGWQRVLEGNPGVTGIGIRHDLGVDMNYAAYMKGNPLSMGPPGSGDSGEVTGGPYVPEEYRRSGPPGGGHREGGPPEGRPPRGKRPPGGGKRGPGKDGPGKGGPPGMGGQMTGGSSAGLAIHKSEGLVPIDDRCASNIPGLYAAGDALGSHMAGAIYTQIGSSLAGSAVQGAIAGEAAAEYSLETARPQISANRIKAVKAEILAPRRREAGYGPAWVTQTLQGVVIPNFVLYIKKENMLRAALAYVEELRDHHVPLLRATDTHELRLAHETRNMVISAEMKLRASLMRTESRCSHYRLDHPEPDDVNWRAWINIFKGADGAMKLEKQPFDKWPA